MNNLLLKRFETIWKTVLVLFLVISVFIDRYAVAAIKQKTTELEYVESSQKKLCYAESFFNTCLNDGGIALTNIRINGDRIVFYDNIGKSRLKKYTFKDAKKVSKAGSSYKLFVRKGKNVYSVSERISKQKAYLDIAIFNKRGKVKFNKSINVTYFIPKKEKKKTSFVKPNYFKIDKNNKLRLAYGVIGNKYKKISGGILEINLKNCKVKNKHKYSFDPLCFDEKKVYGKIHSFYGVENGYYVASSTKKGKSYDYKIDENYCSEKNEIPSWDSGFFNNYSWNNGELVFYNKAGIFYLSKGSTKPEKILEFSGLKNYKKGSYINGVSLVDKNKINLFFTDDPSREIGKLSMVSLKRKNV